MLLSKQTTKRLIIWRASEVTLVLVLVGVVTVLSLRIQSARRQIAEQYIALEQSLGDMGHMTGLKEGLSYRQHDIDHILAFVLERRALGDVVGALEKSAERLGLSLTVPQVEEEVKLDENGEPIEPTGPMREVRLHLVVSGSPEGTLRWLHAVEYQPYLLTVVGWRFATEEGDKVQPGAGRAGLTGGAPGSADGAGRAGQRVGTIEAEVIVSILADRGGSDEN